MYFDSQVCRETSVGSRPSHLRVLSYSFSVRHLHCHSEMLNYRLLAALELETTRLFQDQVNTLRELIKHRTDYICRQFLTRLDEFTKVLVKLRKETTLPVFSQMLVVLEPTFTHPVLRYDIEEIAEAIRSKIELQEGIKRLLESSELDCKSVILRLNAPVARPRVPRDSVSFEHKEAGVSTHVPQLTSRRSVIPDWLCRHCMTLNQSLYSTCQSCGFQPKDTHADV